VDDGSTNEESRRRLRKILEAISRRKKNTTMFISRIFNVLGIEEEVIDLLVSFFDVMAISPKSI
tara:strand:+ start:133 stop:324 length:192 start_codon:yes stop_codon:yes gene_type:complete